MSITNGEAVFIMQQHNGRQWQDLLTCWDQKDCRSYMRRWPGICCIHKRKLAKKKASPKIEQAKNGEVWGKRQTKNLYTYVLQVQQEDDWSDLLSCKNFRACRDMMQDYRDRDLEGLVYRIAQRRIPNPYKA